jgi:two-component system, NarL family, invasion response regulator UvrY
MKTILIVDDHAVVRQGLIRILAEAPEPLSAEEAGTAREAIGLITARAFDAVILDISMPDLNGLETLRAIKSLRPAVPVLILSVHPEEQYAVRAIRSGASAYLTKDSAPEELLKALAMAFQGRRYIGASLAERLADTLEPNAGRPPHEMLSHREFEVFDRLARGRSVGEIAAELFLSPKTVSTYRRRVLEKLGLETTAHLIHYAARNGLGG